MPTKFGSYADVVTAWQNLIAAVERSPDVQASVQEEMLILSELLQDVQDLRARQRELRALRQEVTQKLQAAVEQGKDVTIGIRSVLRGKLGPRNERLVHYEVAPLRRNRRKPAEETPGEEEQPPEGPVLEAAKADPKAGQNGAEASSPEKTAA